MKSFCAFTMACFVVLVVASVVSAQGDQLKWENPCKEDIDKFCSWVRPGKGSIAECLIQNEDQLSPACRKVHLNEMAEVMKKIQGVCASELRQSCGAEVPEEQKMIRPLICLKMQATLSPECKAKLYEALEMIRY